MNSDLPHDVGALDLLADPVELSARLVDIPSPSHQERAIADALEDALLRAFADRPGSVEVLRHGDNVLARTHRGLGTRVVLAGHIDTVPLADNVPHTFEDGILHGCGSVDMKSGLAVYAHVFARLAATPELKSDLTLICYAGEEVASEFNGLGHIARDLPGWIEGDLALLGEPTGGVIEAGCQGSIRVKVVAHGVRAHSARAWLGENAAHRLVRVLERVADYTPRAAVNIDGCVYREGLNVVHLESGVATNTIPDEAWAFVNFRFAPDRTTDEALRHLLDILGEAPGVEILVDDVAGAAAPGLDRRITRRLIDAVGGEVRAKYGWTDVSRFAAAGIPAVNFGCGDPGFAHKKDEQCPVAQIRGVARALEAYLTAP